MKWVLGLVRGSGVANTYLARGVDTENEKKVEPSPSHSLTCIMASIQCSCPHVLSCDSDNSELATNLTKYLQGQASPDKEVCRHWRSGESDGPRITLVNIFKHLLVFTGASPLARRVLETATQKQPICNEQSDTVHGPANDLPTHRAFLMPDAVFRQYSFLERPSRFCNWLLQHDTSASSPLTSILLKQASN